MEEEVTDDWAERIKERLAAYIHWKEISGESIEDTHAPDIEALLKEREVLREALRYIADHSWVRGSSSSEKWLNEFVKVVEIALAYHPMKDGMDRASKHNREKKE